MNLIRLAQSALAAIAVGAAAALGALSIASSGPRPTSVAAAPSRPVSVAPRTVRVRGGVVVFSKRADGATVSRFYPNFVRLA